MSHFGKLILGLWVWDTPTINVLGHSSQICSFSVPFPSLIWLNMPLIWASVEQTMTSVFVQPELSLMTGRRCRSTYGSSSFPLLNPFCLSFLCARGGWVCPFAVPLCTLSLSHSPANFIPPVFGRKALLTHRMWSKLFLFLLLSQFHTITKTWKSSSDQQPKMLRSRTRETVLCFIIHTPYSKSVSSTASNNPRPCLCVDVRANRPKDNTTFMPRWSEADK